MKKTLATLSVCALLAGTSLVAQAVVTELSPAEAALYQSQYQSQIEAVKQTQMEIEARAKVQKAAQEKARAEKAAADARARQKAQQQKAKLEAEKRARQKKLESYADQNYEMTLEMKKLDLEKKRAAVDNAIAIDKARAERAKEKVDIELDRDRAVVQSIRNLSEKKE